MTSRVSRTVTLIVTLVMWLFADSQQSLAQTLPTQKLRRLHVPVEARKSWPAGDWVAVSRSRVEDYEASRIGKINSHEIESAAYQLNWTGQSFNGSVQLKPSAFASNERFLSLGALSASTLYTPDPTTPYVTGQDSKGRNWIYRTESGTHSIIPLNCLSPVRQQGASWIVELDLVPSTRSQLTIQTPKGWQLKTDDSVLISSTTTENRLQWNLSTNLNGSLQLEFQPQIQIQQTVQSLTATVRHSYSIAQSQTELVCDLRYTQIGAKSREVSIRLPLEFTTASLTNEQGQSLEYNLTRQADHQLVTTKLLFESSNTRLIRIRGTLPTPLHTLWAAPEIIPVDTYQLTSRSLIQIQSPLVLEQFNSKGWKVAESSWLPERPIELSLDRLHKSKPIQMVLGQPNASWKAGNAISIFVDPAKVRATNRVQLLSQSSSAFQAELQLPSNWSLTQVTCLSEPTVQIANWSATFQGEQQTLHLEFRNRIPASTSIDLQLQLNHSIPEHSETIALPVVFPISERTMQQCQVGLDCSEAVTESITLQVNQQAIPAVTSAAPDWPFPQSSSGSSSTKRYWNLDSVHWFSLPALNFNKSQSESTTVPSGPFSPKPNSVPAPAQSEMPPENALEKGPSQYIAEIEIEVQKQILQTRYRLKRLDNQNKPLTSIELPSNTELQFVSHNDIALPFEKVSGKSGGSRALIAEHSAEASEYLVVLESPLTEQNQSLQWEAPVFQEAIIPGSVQLILPNSEQLVEVTDAQGNPLPTEQVQADTEMESPTQAFQLWLPQTQNHLHIQVSSPSNGLINFYAFVLTGGLCFWLKQSFRKRFHQLWASCFAVIVTLLIWSPQILDHYATGILCGLLISPLLFSALQSRSSIRRYIRTWKDSHSAISTLSTSKALLMAGACGLAWLFASHGMAQEAASKLLSNVILVPYSENAPKQSFNYVYVSPTLAEKILSPRTGNSPRWLFEQAEYRPATQSMLGQLEADLSLLLTPEVTDQDLIVLPNLGPQDFLTSQVLINDEPVFVDLIDTKKIVIPASAILLILKDSNQTDLSLSQSQRVHVQFDLIKKTPSTSATTTPNTTLPSPTWNLLGLSNQQLISSTTLKDMLLSFVEEQEDRKNTSWSYQLGTARRLELKPPSTTETLESSAFLDTIQTNDILPEAVSIQYLMDFEFSGPLQPLDVSVPIPASAILAEVSGADLIHWNAQTNNAQTELQLTISPQQQTTSVSLKFHLPTEQSSRTIPCLKPQFSEDRSQSVQLDQQLFGIGSSIGLNLESIIAAPSGAVRYSALPSGSSGIQSEKRLAGLEVFRVANSTQFSVQLANRETAAQQQVATQILETPNELQCETLMRITPETSQFHEIIKLDPATQIDSVSVTARKANKLARWHQHNHQLSLFFTERLKEPFQVQLEYRLNLPGDQHQQYVMPELASFSGKLEQQISLTQPSETQLVAKAEGWTPLSLPNNTPASSQKRWTTQTPQQPILFQLKPKPAAPAPQFSQALILHNRAGKPVVYDYLELENLTKLTLECATTLPTELEILPLTGKADIRLNRPQNQILIRNIDPSCALLVKREYPLATSEIPLLTSAQTTGSSVEIPVYCHPQHVAASLAAELTPVTTFPIPELLSAPPEISQTFEQLSISGMIVLTDLEQTLPLITPSSTATQILEKHLTQQAQNQTIQLTTYWFLTSAGHPTEQFTLEIPPQTTITHLIANGLSHPVTSNTQTGQLTFPLSKSQLLHCIEIAALSPGKVDEPSEGQKSWTVSLQQSASQTIPIESASLNPETFSLLLQQWIEARPSSAKLSTEMSETIRTTLETLTATHKQDMTEMLSDQQPLQNLMRELSEAGLAHLIPSQNTQTNTARLLITESSAPSTKLQESLKQFESPPNQSKPLKNSSTLFLAEFLFVGTLAWLGLSRARTMWMYRLLKELKWFGVMVAGLLWLKFMILPALGLFWIIWGGIGLSRRYAQHRLRNRVIHRRLQRQTAAG